MQNSSHAQNHMKYMQ